MYVDFTICFSLLLLAAMLMGGWCHTNYFRHILKKKKKSDDTAWAYICSKGFLGVFVFE